MNLEGLVDLPNVKSNLNFQLLSEERLQSKEQQQQQQQPQSAVGGSLELSEIDDINW